MVCVTISLREYRRAHDKRPVIAILEKSGANTNPSSRDNEIAVTAADMTVLSQIASLDAVSHIRYPRNSKH